MLEHAGADVDRVDQRPSSPLGLRGGQPLRRSTIACTGIEFCKLAFVETRGLAARVIDDMEQRLADVEIPTPISLHINGCPNSCARIRTADIGLKGQYIGEEYVFQVHLGGGLASPEPEGGLGRTVRGLKVTADNLCRLRGARDRTFLRERDPEASSPRSGAWRRGGFPDMTTTDVTASGAHPLHRGAEGPRGGCAAALRRAGRGPDEVLAWAAEDLREEAGRGVLDRLGHRGARREHAPQAWTCCS
ncbi:hypothetical protein QJS66_19730 [Kocuria rhizophila]|nr:hypothetical protein QJS66_19730 [Kocuria rhizophila]